MTVAGHISNYLRILFFRLVFLFDDAMTLQWCQLSSDHFQMLPSEDFMGLDDYIESAALTRAGWDTELSGVGVNTVDWVGENHSILCCIVSRN